MSDLSTVVILNDYCHINGGASRVAIEEAIALAEAGREVIFLGANGPVCETLKNSSVRVICLEQPELQNAKKYPQVLFQALWNFKAYRAMRGLLRDLNPANTIIHLHGYTKALSTSPLRAACKVGFQVICTLHDFFSVCPNGGFFDYPTRKPCQRRALSLNCITAHCDKRHYAHKLYRVLRSLIQRYLGGLPQTANDYITLSDRSAELLRPYLPKSARYHNLENITDLPKQPPIEAAKNKIFVFIGRLDVEKGVEFLLEAAKRAKISLLLIGDGPLRPLAEQYENCRVTGWLSPEEVMIELNQARCLIFPSLWYETYGLVVAEAASRGIPAIVSDISAAAERVSDGVTGWHIRSGGLESLISAIELAKNNEQLERAGLAAYERFWANPPTAMIHTQKLLGIYESVLSARR